MAARDLLVLAAAACVGLAGVGHALPANQTGPVIGVLTQSYGPEVFGGKNGGAIDSTLTYIAGTRCCSDLTCFNAFVASPKSHSGVSCCLLPLVVGSSFIHQVLGKCGCAGCAHLLQRHRG